MRATLFLACLLTAAPLWADIRIQSQTRLKADQAKGELRLTPGQIAFDREDLGRADNYFRLQGQPGDLNIDFASVICLDGRFTGLKGFHQALGPTNGDMDIHELLVMGSIAQNMVRNSQPWLLDASGRHFEPEDLCSSAYREAMKAYNLETMPEHDTAGLFDYRYEPRRHTLTVRWGKSRP